MEAIYSQTQKCFNFTYMEFLTDYNNSMLIVSWVTFTLAFPVICVAMYGLHVLMRTDRVTPVYLINLLVSDMLQICIRPMLHMVSAQSAVYAVMIFSYIACMMVNVCFMMCIAAERYLMVVFPVWYRFNRKKSVCLSCIVWLLPVITMPISSLILIMGGIHCSQFLIGCVTFYLLPYPLIVFFFVGTWRALSKSTSLSSQEQKWIMGTLALVLCIYTMCFMPFIVSMIIYAASGEYTWKAYMLDTGVFCNTLLCMNPLFDPLLYVFMRKDAKDILEAFPCCHCESNDQVQPETPPPLATDRGDDETQA